MGKGPRWRGVGSRRRRARGCGRGGGVGRGCCDAARDRLLTGRGCGGGDPGFR